MSSSLPSPPEFGARLPIAPAPEVLRFLALRRSTSAMTLEAPAPEPDQLDEMIRLAVRVPDHGKLAPWRFIVLEGDEKAAFARRLEAIAAKRDDPTLVGKLAKLKVPPLAVFVVSSPKSSSIPEWEQRLSAAAACTNLLYAALAMGFGANWITDWYSYDAEVGAVLGLGEGERVAGCILMGTAREAPLERERPATEPLVTRWRP